MIAVMILVLLKHDEGSNLLVPIVPTERNHLFGLYLVWLQTQMLITAESLLSTT